MEFNEKLQELRKSKNLTQEELAQQLYVSRTAISKWESGRGYPNIESLKALAKFFSVTVDELLSGEEVLTIAEEDGKQNRKYLCDMVYGLLDLSVAMFFFLPFFRENSGDTISGVSLLSLSGISSYTKTAYFIAVICIFAMGGITLAFQRWDNSFWISCKSRISEFMTVAALLIFIISQQPYAAVFMLVFLLIKGLLIIKSR